MPRTGPFERIEDALPSGFHDGALFELQISRERREMTLILGADMSTGIGGDCRVRLRRCRVHITGLSFVSIEPPFLEGSGTHPGGGMIDTGILEGVRLKEVHPQDLPTGVHASYIFMSETNSFIYFAGRDGEFEWLE
jgi:hypothetical protein